MTTLDLIRHGEPVGGRKYRGQVDDPLSEKGWSQMQGALEGDAPWTRLITSPLQRCRAFAEVLAAKHGLPLTVDARFQEVGFGAWEGKTAAEIEAEAPGSIARFKTDPLGARPHGAEPLDAFHTRVAGGIDDLLLSHPGEHLLVVCHAGVIRMALAHALAIPLVNAYRIEVACAAMTRIRFASQYATLVFHGARS